MAPQSICALKNPLMVTSTPDNNKKLLKPDHVEGVKIRVCIKSEDVFGFGMR